MGRLPNRILKESICTSSEIDALAPEEEVFFYRLIVNCDDHGRLDARPPILRAKCFPLRIDQVKDKDIERWLRKLESRHLLFVYVVDGQPYLQLTTWEKHQQVRAQRSKYPGPEEADQHLQSDDINCNQLQSNVPVIQSNPIQSESESNTYMRNAAKAADASRFERFWEAYPKKRSKGQAEKAWAKIKPSEQLLEQMLAALEQAKTSADWTREGGKYIPYPATWLNAKGWEDDYRQQADGNYVRGETKTSGLYDDIDLYRLPPTGEG